MLKFNVKMDLMSNYNYYIYLIIFYVLAHGGIFLIPSAIFWDDWTLYELNDDVILNQFKQVGSVFNITGYLHIILLPFGPVAYKVLTFIIFFATALLIDEILKSYHNIKPEIRFSIVLILLVLPFYQARVTLIVMPYTLSYFLFFTAWILMSKNRIFSLVIFFISFNTNSMLVYFIIPFISHYYQSLNSTANFKTFAKFCYNNFDFTLLPFVFFMFKMFYYPPSGIFEGYNEQFSLKNLIVTPLQMIKDWLTLESPFLIFLLAIPISHFLFFIHKTDYAQRAQFLRVLGVVGMITFVAGAFPYWILGHPPYFAGWYSRHQLLLPLGTSLIIVSLIYRLTGKMRCLMLAFLISAFISTNIKSYVDFYFDWQKQKQLIELLKSDDNVKDADLVIFQDNASNLNALDRMYSFYEWNGLLFQAFGDETRMGINLQNYNKFMKFPEYEGFFPQGDSYRATKFNRDSLSNISLVQITPDRSKFRYLTNGSPLIGIEVYNWSDPLRKTEVK